jgi:two-component system, NtrC family, response regulator AtoC
VANARILILDDDDLIRNVLAERLERSGHEVAVAGSVREARALIAVRVPDIAFLDVKLPDGEGTDLLTDQFRNLDTAVVMMTAHATVQSAVSALKHGARDYLEKPFSFERLDASLSAALEVTRLRRELRALRDGRGGSGGQVLGSSAAMRKVFTLVQRVAPADSTTVLLEGETGTGKGVVARMIHELSPRQKGPFLAVTCSALAETLMESELFGHEKGAFTDARQMKRGLVELAEGGTLFMDEIGELSLRIQAKLLEFIENRTFRRVGGTRDLSVDARLVAATNRNLEEEVAEGRFRADLYYRLRVVPVKLPPLRDRDGDVELLAKAFLDVFNREFGKRVRRIDPEAKELLDRYRWPGNVRELRNVIERGVLLSEGPVLGPDMLPPEVQGRISTPYMPDLELGPDGLDIEHLEETLLMEALRRANGNRTAAGRLLGLSRHQIRNRLRKYGVEV